MCKIDVQCMVCGVCGRTAHQILLDLPPAFSKPIKPPRRPAKNSREFPFT